MAFITEIIGYAAGVMGVLIMIPQLIKTLRTRSVKDVSFRYAEWSFYDPLNSVCN